MTASRDDGQPGDERFRALAELCGDGVLLVRQARIAQANIAAAYLLGCADPQQLQGRLLDDFLPEQAALEGSSEHALRRVDGTAAWAEIRISRHIGPQEAGERIVLLRDAGLGKERDAPLARARDEFLAMVSHELRTPLNAIQSWAHVLENYYAKEVSAAPLAQRALRGIHTGVDQQVRLIEDLLDVTRMLSGRLRLVKQPMTLLPALEAALESVRGMATAKHIALAVSLRIDGEQIDGDPGRVQQIFRNLLSNAVKFTSDYGHVWVDASRNEREACVTVRDDGAGISPDLLPHLFDRFSQEGSSGNTRGHSGLGVGLSMVRHLVELHGGRVEAASPGEGRGTSFSVHLPLRSAGGKP